MRIVQVSLGAPQESPEVSLNTMGGLGGPCRFPARYLAVLGRSLGAAWGVPELLVMSTKEIVMFLRGPWGSVKVLKISSGSAADQQEDQHQTSSRAIMRGSGPP